MFVHPSHVKYALLHPSGVSTKRIHMLALLSATVALSQAHATPAATTALPIRDLNPFVAGFEIPEGLPSGIDTEHRTIANVGYDISNISLGQQSGNETAIADAELHRWQLTVTHAINARLCIQLELPYQSVSGGSLDSFIEDFHHTFGLPNGNRKLWPRNRLLVDYTVDNQSLFHLEHNTAGMADISARAGWQFNRGEKRSATMWFTVKLPTGNANHLTGSGAIDLAFTLAASQQLSDRWRAYEQASLSLLGKGSRLRDEQKPSALSGVAGIALTLTHNLDVASQLNWHSALYNTDIRMLGPATQLSIGPRYHTAKWQGWLAITEDIAVDTAPDVQFQWVLSHRF